MRMNTISFCPHCRAYSKGAQKVRGSADIVKCQGCGLVYLRTRPIDADLRVLYQSYADEESHMRLPKSVEERKSSGLRRENFINWCIEPTTFPVNSAVADIGCGWGAMLDCVKDKYPVTDARGFEICKKAANYCTENICECGSDGEFWDFFNMPAYFNLVTMCHVLEHMTDLSRSLKHIHGMLKHGGMFAGIVPNFASRGSFYYKDRWYWLDANFHYLHFEDRTLRRVLADHGFHNIRTETHRGDFEPARLKEAYEAFANQELSSMELDSLILQEDRAGRGEELWFSCFK